MLRRQILLALATNRWDWWGQGCGEEGGLEEDGQVGNWCGTLLSSSQLYPCHLAPCLT